MAKYIALRDTWLSHECRAVRTGEEFETEFPPAADGKPMRLTGNIEEVVETAADKGQKPKKAKDDDALV